MDKRIVSWGPLAGVFVLLLVFSTWNGGWWHSDAPAARTQPHETGVTPRESTSNPFAATNPFAASIELAQAPIPGLPPPTAALNSAQFIEDAAEPLLSEDEYEAMIQESNRGHEHSSRTH